MSKQVIFNLLFIFIIFGLVFYFLRQNNIIITVPENKNSNSFNNINIVQENNVITEQVDLSDLSDNTENNGVNNATAQENVRNPASLSQDELDLVQVFADKYSKPTSSVLLVVQVSQDPYYKGVVDFDNSGLGANFFAYKNNGTFEIVGVENGVISCNLIEGYNFPASIIPNCYSPNSGSVINR